jgi:hypothetical protein
MDNGPPAYAPLFFAAVLAVHAFICIRYSEAFKHWRDRTALFGFQRQINQGYSVESYRRIGWVFAQGAVALLLLSMVLALLPR